MDELNQLVAGAAELREKPVLTHISLADWKLLQRHAASRRVPITDVVRECVERLVTELREAEESQ